MAGLDATREIRHLVTDARNSLGCLPLKMDGFIDRRRCLLRLRLLHRRHRPHVIHTVRALRKRHLGLRPIYPRLRQLLDVTLLHVVAVQRSRFSPGTRPCTFASGIFAVLLRSRGHSDHVLLQSVVLPGHSILLHLKN